jgi:hypothetical protein
MTHIPSRITDPLALLTSSETSKGELLTLLIQGREILEGPLTPVQRRLHSLLHPWLKNDKVIPLIQYIAAAEFKEARLYREQFGTIEAYAKSIGIVRETFHRYAQKGSVLIHFLESGRNPLPEGEKLKGLATLPQEHQIPAWDEIHRRAGSHKLTNDVFGFLLLEYQTAHHVWDEPPLSEIPDEGSIAGVSEVTVEIGDKGDVPPNFKAGLLNAVPPKQRERIVSAYTRGNPAVSFYSFAKRVVEASPSNEAEGMEQAINDLEEHDPEFARKLKGHAYLLLATSLGEFGARKARENAREKARYHRKQSLAAMTPKGPTPESAS